MLTHKTKGVIGYTDFFCNFISDLDPKSESS
jgi:hypothetical protein